MCIDALLCTAVTAWRVIVADSISREQKLHPQCVFVVYTLRIKYVVSRNFHTMRFLLVILHAAHVVMSSTAYVTLNTQSVLCREKIYPYAKAFLSASSPFSA